MNKNKKIDDSRIKAILKRLNEEFNETGKVSEAMIEDMKNMRQLFIEHEQPTIVKAIRLVYETYQKYDAFNVEIWKEDEEHEGIEDYSYFLGLLANPTNKYNREEIKEMNAVLKFDLTGRS